MVEEIDGAEAGAEMVTKEIRQRARNLGLVEGRAKRLTGGAVGGQGRGKLGNRMYVREVS